MDSLRAQIVSFLILVTALIAEAIIIDKLIVPIIPRLLTFVVIGILQFLFLFPVIHKKLDASTQNIR